MRKSAELADDFKANTAPSLLPQLELFLTHRIHPQSVRSPVVAAVVVAAIPVILFARRLYSLCAARMLSLARHRFSRWKISNAQIDF